MEYKKVHYLYEMSDFIEGSAYVEGGRLYSVDASSCKSSRTSKTSKNCGGSTGSRSSKGKRGAVGTNIDMRGLDGLVFSIDEIN